jgi:hypothetical protein
MECQLKKIMKENPKMTIKQVNAFAARISLAVLQ